MSITVTDTSDAERRALKIGLRLDAIADNYEAVIPMIREALELGDHEVLGYPSPGAYLKDRFGGALSRMPIVVRREFVGELTDAGLSTRAIAAVTGTSQKTADRDARLAGESCDSPAPSTLTDEPGRVTKITGPGSATDPHVDRETGEVSDDYDAHGSRHEDYLSDDGSGEEVTTSTEATDTGIDPVVLADEVEEVPGEEVEPTPPAPSRPVTGLDGKTYTRPEPSKPKRRPLTDAFTDKRWAMQKALESLSRLTQDDRFPQNANQVATSNRSDLIRIKDQLQLVIDRLPENT